LMLLMQALIVTSVDWVNDYMAGVASL